MEKRKRFSPETAFVCLLTLLGVVIMMVSLVYGFGTFPKTRAGSVPLLYRSVYFHFRRRSPDMGFKSKTRPALFAQEGRKNLPPHECGFLPLDSHDTAFWVCCGDPSLHLCLLQDYETGRMVEADIYFRRHGIIYLSLVRLLAVYRFAQRVLE